MSAPEIPELPELPTFPSGPGLPDQPGPFFAKALAFLEALRSWRAALGDFGAFVEENGGAGGGGAEGDTVTVVTLQGFRPMVTGENPPVFIINGEHDLVMTEI